MRPSGVVVLDPFDHHPLEVSTPEDQDPIQALSTTRTDLSLHVGIGLRHRDRSLDYQNGLGSQHGVAGSGELGVVVVDQKPNRRSLQPPDQVAALLSDPGRVGIRRHSEPDDPPARELHI